jgi:hypothetical protein
MAADFAQLDDGAFVAVISASGSRRTLRTASVVYRGKKISTDFQGYTPWPAIRLAIVDSGRRSPDKHGARRNAVYGRFYFAKSRAASRGMEFSITLDDLFDQGDRQGWRCAISNMRFVYESGAAWSNPYGLSLDRIDSSRGYSKDNVRWVLVAVNAAMGQWGEEPLRIIARRIHSQQKNAHRK